ILWLWSIWNIIWHFWVEYEEAKWFALLGRLRIRGVGVTYRSSLVAELIVKVMTFGPKSLRIFPLFSYIGFSAAIFSAYFHAQFDWSFTVIGTSISVTFLGFQFWMTFMIRPYEWKEFIGVSCTVLGYAAFSVLLTLQLDQFI